MNLSAGMQALGWVLVVAAACWLTFATWWTGVMARATGSPTPLVPLVLAALAVAAWWLVCAAAPFTLTWKFQ